MTGRFLGRIGAAAVILGAMTGALRASERSLPLHHQPDARLGEVVFTLIGQVTNAPPASAQYGYLTGIAGMGNLFSGAPEDETTAYFTFFNDATTIAVRNNGPLKIVEREGTTTVYYNVAPHATFSDPDSFRDGQPVLIMTFKQMVIIDNELATFSVVNSNNVTTANAFQKDGHSWVLGHRHDNFRWSLQGHSPETTPPDGYFAAYIVKVQPD